jgi:hypothetical protein
VALLNEDGRRLRLTLNRVASLYLGFSVAGVVVFVTNGVEAFGDAPDSLWEALVRLRSHEEAPVPAESPLHDWPEYESAPEAPEAVVDGSEAVSTLSMDEADLGTAAMLLRSHGYQVLSPKPHAKPKVRTGAPDTSKAIEPKLNSGLGRVLDLLRTHPERGHTDDELEEWTGRTHQSVSAARRNGVIKGLIYDTGEKRKTRSGNDAIVWKAVER